MDSINRAYAHPILTTLLLLLVAVVSLNVLPNSYAHDVVPSCQISTIRPAFDKYLISATQQEVVEMQTKLEDSGYGRLKKDGVLGLETRRALQRLCLDFEVDETKDTVETLLYLLNLTYEVSKNYPKWRETIKSDAFILWQSQQEDHEAIHVALHIGPVEQVLEIMQRYTAQQTKATTQTDDTNGDDEKTETTPIEDSSPEGDGDKAEKVKVETEQDSAEVEVKTTQDENVDKGNQNCEDLKIKQEKVLSRKALRTQSGELKYYQWQPMELSEEEQACEEEDKEWASIKKVLAGIEGISYPTEYLFLASLGPLFSAEKLDYSKYQQKILDESLTLPQIFPPALSITGGECGCSEEFAGQVYGFYPYWLASEREIVSSQLNLLDRMAYYAVTIDPNSNNETESIQWSEEGGAGNFIRTAHRHRVKVDVVLRIIDWQSQNEQKIKRLSKKIVSVAQQQFNSKETDKLTKMLPFVGGDKQLKADGITLYFDNYQSGDAMDNVVTTIELVARKLRETDRDYVINLMLDTDVAAQCEGSQSCQSTDIMDVLAQLKEVLVVDKDDDGIIEPLADDQISTTVTKLMLYLPPPSTETKKLLRKRIEDVQMFDGEVRDSVYHKTVPILPTPNSKTMIAQFEHDLIYFKRSYGGVGLWLIPQSDSPVNAQVEDAFNTHYRPDQRPSLLGSFMESEASGVCDIVCPNRWLFRIAFDVLAFLLLGYGLLAVWHCKLRRVYRQHRLYFVSALLLTVVIAVLSLLCDPFWIRQVDLVAASLIVVTLLAIITVYVRRVIQPPLP